MSQGQGGWRVGKKEAGEGRSERERGIAIFTGIPSGRRKSQWRRERGGGGGGGWGERQEALILFQIIILCPAAS